MIGGFRSDLSITCMIDGNVGNVSAGVLFSKVAYQRKRWKRSCLIPSVAPPKHLSHGMRFYECILFVRLWEFCEQNSEEKHLKLTKTRSLSSLASSDVMMEFISSREFFNGNHTATKVTNHGSVLSTFLFLDQSEKSPDSGLATDKYSSNCIRRTFPPRQKI